MGRGKLAAAASSQATKPVTTALPQNTSAPSIAGDARVGTRLSVTTGSWSNSPSRYSYSWQRCARGTCATISGATSSTYTAATGDVGDDLQATVTATNPHGESAPAKSSTTAAVVPQPPVAKSLPTISGSPREGSTLTASSGNWTNSPASYSFAWEDCPSGLPTSVLATSCVIIAGADAATYTLTAGDVGNQLRVLVSASNSGGQSLAAASSMTAEVSVSSSAVGSGGSTTAGGGSGGGNGSGSSGNAGTGDTGTGDTGGGSGDPTTSTPTQTVAAPVDSARPSISGTAEQGSTLTASTGNWNNDPSAYSFQWQDCAPAGGSCSPVTGATAATYTPGAADVGDSVNVLVTATNAGGSGTASSSPTGVVLPLPPVNVMPPTVNGTAQQGDALTASTGTWLGSPTSYSYGWLDCTGGVAGSGLGATCVAIPGADTAQYTPTAGDIGSYIRVVVSASNTGGPTLLPAASATTAAVLAPTPPPPPVNTALPSISGTARQGATLSANTGTWSNSPTGYSYQWQDCDSSGATCESIPGATASAYTLQSSDVGETLSVLVTASNATGTNSASSTVTATVLPLPPNNLARPSISAGDRVGDSLTAAAGTWSGGPSGYSYQWQDCNSSGGNCAAINGATSSTYTLQTSDVGATVAVVVTASNQGGSSTAASIPTAIVEPLAPVSATVPTISGTAQQDRTLSASAGTWDNSPTSYGYQWQDCNTSGASCTAITGATSSSYTLQSSDVGKTISVVVAASNSGGTADATSTTTGVVVEPAPVVTVSPTISGTAQQGSTLSASTGTWSGAPTGYSYQWKDCNAAGGSCSAISGATNATYTAQSGDVGGTLAVTVTATNAGGSTAATSPATLVVEPPAPVNTAAPSITGTAVLGSTLSASTGTWSGAPTGFSYQWQDCNTSGGACTAIAGATSSSYTPTSSDVGDTLTVVVSATNGGGSVSATSPATTAITAPSTNTGTCSSPCTTTPAVSGSPRVGQTLSVSEGKWSVDVNAYSYQWEDCSGASCSPVAGGISTPQCSGTSFSCPDATEQNFQTYTVQPSDQGRSLAVVVTAENGSSYTATTAQTAAVPSGAPSNSQAPTVSGTAAIGNVLTATQGTWSGSGNTYSYQWQDCLEDDILPSGCQPISGATSSTYTVTSSDGGYLLDVAVTATNANGSQTVSSNQTSSYVPVPPAAIGTPTAAGQAVLGSTLTAMYHFSGSVPSYSFRWERCDTSGNSCTPVAGATSQTYTIGAADENSTLRVTVTASNDGGAQTASATSPATPAIQTPTGSGAPSSTGAPAISGSAAYGGTLTTSVGTWSGTGLSYSYQWQDCNSTGASCSNVTAGGDAYAYTVSATDIGEYLRVQVTATNGSGSSTADSGLTAEIQTPSATTAGAQPAGLTIVGDKFENDDGQTVTFHGEDLSGTDTACGNDGVFSDNMPATSTTAAELAPWNSNGITLGTNEDCWLGINGTSPTGATYQSDLSSFVNTLNNYGQYVMLSPKATAPGTIEAGPNEGEANAPDEDHTPWYWAGIANAERNNPNIIDAVWSELATTSVYWNCYESVECGSTASANGNGPTDGGAVCGGGAWTCYYYTEGTMQQAVDITRAFGYNGPISIPCIGYAVWCGDPTTGGSTYGGSWVMDHPDDPDNQMTAEAHWYEQDACDTNACHEAQLQAINAAGYPLILGESGEAGDNNAFPSCGSWSGAYDPPTTYGTYSPSYQGTEGWLPDLYNKGLSGWFAYAFNSFNTDGVLINANGTPYEPGTEPASGWYSNCMQTLDRSLPG